jgi:hypothetical protein
MTGEPPKAQQIENKKQEGSPKRGTSLSPSRRRLNNLPNCPVAKRYSRAHSLSSMRGREKPAMKSPTRASSNQSRKLAKLFEASVREL